MFPRSHIAFLDSSVKTPLYSSMGHKRVNQLVTRAPRTGFGQHRLDQRAGQITQAARDCIGWTEAVCAWFAHAVLDQHSPH